MQQKSSENPKDILEAMIIATQYGFEYRKTPTVEKEDLKLSKSLKEHQDDLDEDLFPIEEAMVLLKEYKENFLKEQSDPKSYYIEGAFGGSHKKKRKKSDSEIINLHIINIEKSIADGVIIKTAETILRENGHKNMFVRINNVGGKDAQSLFQKEATSYYRKKIADLNDNCRQLFKEGLHELYKKVEKECSEVYKSAPKPMDFLGEDSRKHFSEVLEYIENIDLPYEISETLLGDKNFSSHTVFQIIDQDTDEIIAAGTRYNTLARKMGLRKDIPAIGLVFKLDKPKKSTLKLLNKIRQSKFFFIQIGYEAKLKSLQIIDELRKSSIYLKHKLFKEKLTEQISSAKRSKIDHIILMGQKEAVTKEVMVRDKDFKSQKTVPLSELASYLKNLK